MGHSSTWGIDPWHIFSPKFPTGVGFFAHRISNVPNVCVFCTVFPMFPIFFCTDFPTECFLCHRPFYILCLKGSSSKMNFKGSQSGEHLLYAPKIKPLKVQTQNCKKTTFQLCHHSASVRWETPNSFWKRRLELAKSNFLVLSCYLSIGWENPKTLLKTRNCRTTFLTRHAGSISWPAKSKELSIRGEKPK